MEQNDERIGDRRRRKQCRVELRGRVKSRDKKWLKTLNVAQG